MPKPLHVSSSCRHQSSVGQESLARQGIPLAQSQSVGGTWMGAWVGVCRDSRVQDRIHASYLCTVPSAQDNIRQ